MRRGGGGLGAAALLFQLGQRTLELFEPFAQTLHLFARLAHRSELVDRCLNELIHLVLHLLDAGLDGLLSGAHQLMQQLAGQESGAATPLLEDDLGEHLRGDVGAGAVVHHLHVLAGANPLRQLVERDVAAFFRVVELAALVALDQTVHRGDLSLVACRIAASPGDLYRSAAILSTLARRIAAKTG